ncbi:PAS domain-containing protein [Methylobacterium sp. J-048]|uniref:PAS domain-containing protein n=1 Tax=unclassified Methylobacterium TaxID=2615210 RepID=UPI001FB86F22|nr:MULTISPECIES: PAS domain-containing protein [unclassified Methylobacterium]MCJ2060201.1 PAS domain-containing protein [Methylobacterium sp. J-048]MCJ2094943.1 PAS domain-containing protein [Methylobacterium sp. J-072]
MPRRSSNSILSSASLPLTTLSIGLWEEDVSTDRIRGDAVMGQMYGLTDAEVAEGISRSHLFSIFHPDEVSRDPELRRSVREQGGLFVWEHRIMPAPGIVRWVLVRGHYERGPDGRMRGRGIVIDVTDTRADGHVDGPSRYLAACQTLGSPAETMADGALKLWDLMHQLDDDSAVRLRPSLKALLFELGRQIAAALPDGQVAAASRPFRDPKLH